MNKLLGFLFLSFGVFYFCHSAGAQVLIMEPNITVSPDVYYPFDEVLYIEGLARPNSQVQLQFSKQGSRPVQFHLKSDSRGEWVLAEKIKLEEGDWEARARVVTEEGGTSNWSNPRIFKAISTGITIGGVNIKFATLSLIIVLLLAIIAVIIVFTVWRIRRLRMILLSKEVSEAKESVRAGFSEIRQNLLAELRIMESSGKTLTSDEIARKEHIMRELEILERNMEREIQDIQEKI